MKPAVIIMVVAALAATLTAILVKIWLDQHAANPADPVTQSIEVIVLARSVAAGAPLQSDDLRYDRWPAALASPRLMVRQGSLDGRSALAGQIARRALFEGEPVTAEATAHRDNVGLMAGLLTPGMRAVSIPISNPSAVSGFITPGDLVDVMVAADLARTIDGNRPPPSDKLLRFAAETVLTGIRVLAVDQQYSRASDGGAVQGKTATLEVSPKQAEILTVAGQLGPLQLVLRGKGEDNTTIVPPGFSGDVEISGALRALLANRPATGGALGRRPGPLVGINRAGSVTLEEFVR